METKGILRMVLVIVSSVMMLGSICDKKDKEGNPAGDSSPNIIVNSDNKTGYDLGDVLLGQEVEYMFIIGNNGTAKLTYYAPVISSGVDPPLFQVLYYSNPGAYKPCIAWEGYTGELQPGEECAFLLRFRCIEDPGHFTVLLVIKSNDPDNPTHMDSLVGDCIPVPDITMKSPDSRSGDKRSGKYR